MVILLAEHPAPDRSEGSVAAAPDRATGLRGQGSRQRRESSPQWALWKQPLIEERIDDERSPVDDGAVAPAETAVERAKADLERLLALRSRVGEMEHARVGDGVLHTDPALAELLPGGGLQPGGVYSVQGSTSLVMALLAGPSSAGAWCAVVGMPGFGAEAAARSGVDLDRLVMVPRPGDKWFGVTAALADAVTVVVTAPRGRVGEAEAARLAARLRQRGAVLLVCGGWPRVDARLGVASSGWTGLGEGHGYLGRRELTVAVESRSWGRERRARLVLQPGGGVQGVIAQTGAAQTGAAQTGAAQTGTAQSIRGRVRDQCDEPPLLRAVG